jgi:AhpD family alkylhydroperoxidase
MDQDLVTETVFPELTPETAPAPARRPMAATARHLGYLPAPVARMASSPQLLEGFLKVSGLFEATSLDPVAREVVVLTIAVRNGCHVCVAMHTARLAGLGAGADLIPALREGRPLADARLAAVQDFTLAVIATAGAVTDAELRTFFSHGYTAKNALEIVLGIGAYTMSTLANRMTRAPLDDRLRPFAWNGQGAVWPLPVTERDES